MPDDVDYLSLFSGDQPTAQTQAAALANAIRQRRAAGTLGMITGDPAMGAVGKEMTGNADKMEQGLLGAAQHRAQQQQMLQHYENEARRWEALTGVRQQQADQQARALELKANERGATMDAYGNPILYQKHGEGGALPGAVAAAGGGARAAGAGASGMGMTPAALDQAAEMYARTGTLPPLRGKAGAGLAVRIQNRAAEMSPGADLAGNKASYKADTGSLAKLQQQSDNIEAFEQTGKKNIENLLATSHNIINLGVPWLNKPARWIATNIRGDPNQSAFEAARQTAATEAAKILGGALGPLSDSARHEAERMMDANATPEQLAAAARTLITDFGNRKAANQAQLAEIRSRASGKAAGGERNEPAGATVTVMWKGKAKAIPAEKLQDALKAGATEVK